MDNLFLGIIVAWTCLGLGAYGLRLFRLSPSHIFEDVALSGALGFGVMAFIVFIVGSLKLLYPVLMVVIVVGIFFLTLKLSRTMLSQAVKETIRGFRTAPLHFKLAIGLSLVVAGFSLCGALAPPTGQDELCYHLTQPKNYLRAHAIYEVPFSTNSLWPYLGEMLFTLGLLLKGPETAKFFHFCYYILTILLVYSCASRLFGKKAARWASVFYAVMPAAYMQASYAYIDHVLACYFLAAFYCVAEFLESKKIRWAALGGIFCGLCLSSKLIGLFSVPALAAVVFLDLILRKDAKNILRGAFLFGGCAVIFGALFYVRSWILRGNPVFPFYPQFFGGHGWPDPTYVNTHGRGKGAIDFLLLLWDTAIHPQWFGGEYVGVFFLAFFPLSFFTVRLERKFAYSLAYLFVVALLWFTVDQNIRFIFGGLAIVAVISGAAAAAILDLPGAVFRGMAQTMILIFLAIQAAIGVYHYREEAALIFRQDKEHYLMSRERTYAVARTVNPMLRPDDTILSFGEIRGFYFNNRMVLEGDFDQFTHYSEKNFSSLERRNYFRGCGLTHILMLEGPDRQVPGWLEQDSIYFKSKAVIRTDGMRYVLYQID